MFDDAIVDMDNSLRLYLRNLTKDQKISRTVLYSCFPYQLNHKLIEKTLQRVSEL